MTTNGTTVSYTPNPGSNGGDSFYYTIANSAGVTATTNVVLSDFLPVAQPDDAVQELGKEGADGATPLGFGQRRFQHRLAVALGR